MGSGLAWLHLPHPLPPKQLKHFSPPADIWRKPGAGISCARRAFGEAAASAMGSGLPSAPLGAPAAARARPSISA